MISDINHNKKTHLNESDASTIVCDGQAKGIFRLYDVNNFRLSTNVCKYKIIKCQLSSKQAAHIHFVGI